jgi:putative glycosyltransferase
MSSLSLHNPVAEQPIPRLSIVTTLYRSAPHLHEFYTRISTAAAELGISYELIFVNDGSPDNSLEIARRIQAQDQRVVVVNLSRNFGHHPAIRVGLEIAKGEHIFLIDCDLQESPELLTSFYQEMSKSPEHVLYGVQKSRKGGFFEMISGAIFYKLFNALSDCPIPVNFLTVRIMSRKFVDAYLQFEEREMFIGGLWTLTGFKQRAIVVNKSSREKTAYSIQKRISLFVNSITSFSNKPLVWVFYLGCFMVLISGLIGSWLIGSYLMNTDYKLGWPSLIVSIWFIGGLTICCLGVLGIYLSKIFIESKRRPYAIIEDVYSSKGDT